MRVLFFSAVSDQGIVCNLSVSETDSWSSDAHPTHSVANTISIVELFFGVERFGVISCLVQQTDLITPV